jgi:hypothetical protein
MTVGQAAGQDGDRGWMSRCGRPFGNRGPIVVQSPSAIGQSGDASAVPPNLDRPEDLVELYERYPAD